jgi:hypothetical protein
MKTIYKFLIGIGSAVVLATAIFAMPVFGQAFNNLWKPSSGNLVPVVSTWGLQIPQLGAAANPCLTVSNTGVFSTQSCSGVTGAVVATKHTDGTYTYLAATTTTDLGRGTALLTAMSAAVVGDNIYLASTTYDIATGLIDLSAGNTGGISLHGAGKYSTFIKSKHNSGADANIVITIGTNSQITDLTFLDYANAGVSQYPIGSYQPINNFIIKSVVTDSQNGTSDGLYITNSATGTIADYTCNSSYDCIYWTNSGLINIYDSVLTSKDNSHYVGVTDGISMNNAGNMNVWNSQVTAQGGGTSNTGYNIINSGIVSIYGGVASSSNNGPPSLTSVDLKNTGSTIQVASDVTYSPSRINGTITAIQPVSTAQSFNAISSAATSTFLGNIMVGNSFKQGQFDLQGLFLTQSIPQIQVSTSQSDLVSLLTLGNMDQGIYASGCITFANGGTMGQGLIGGIAPNPSTNEGDICLMGPNFSAFSGVPPNGMVVETSDGGLVFGATSANNASNTIAFSSGPSFASSTYDMVIKHIASASNTGDAAVGIGTTSPWAKLAVSASSTYPFPDFVIASTTNGASGGAPALIVANNGNMGLGTTTPGSILSVNGVANFTTATSSFYGNGINLSKGCFAISGTCVGGSGGGGSGTVNTGNTPQLAWYSSNGTAVSGTSTNPLTVGSLIATSSIATSTFGGFVGIATTSPYAALSVVGSTGVVADHYTATGTIASQLPYASSTAVTVTGQSFLQGGVITTASIAGVCAQGNGFTFSGHTDARLCYDTNTSGGPILYNGNAGNYIFLNGLSQADFGGQAIINFSQLAGSCGGPAFSFTNNTSAGVGYSCAIAFTIPDVYIGKGFSAPPYYLDNGLVVRNDNNYVGIGGTTTPGSLLSIQEDSSQSPFTSFFTIASTTGTGTATSTIFQIDANGHKITGGNSPTCGAGCSSVVGDDQTMRTITGVGVTSLTINLAHKYAYTPVCVASDESGGTTVSDASSTPSTVVLNLSASLTTKSIGIICQQSSNFTY